MTGYTEKQAERLLGQIDAQVRKVQTEIEKLDALVTDHNPSRSTYLSDQVRNWALELKDVVRRRKR